MPIEIRIAQAADADAMKSCVEAAYRHYVVRMGMLPGPMLEDYASVIDRHTAFIAESDGEVIGILVLIQTESGMLLDNIAVHPAYQGKGLGRRLLALAESEARSRDVPHLDIYTNESMTESLALYTALGFVETGRRTEHGYRRIYMRKTLI